MVLYPGPMVRNQQQCCAKTQHSHHLKKSLIGLLHLPIFCYKIKYSKDLDRYQLSVIDSLLVEYVWLQLNRVSCYTVCWPKLAGQQSTKKSSTRNIYRSVQEGTVLLEELLFFTFPVILIIALHICNHFNNFCHTFYKWASAGSQILRTTLSHAITLINW